MNERKQVMNELRKMGADAPPESFASLGWEEVEGSNQRSFRGLENKDYQHPNELYAVPDLDDVSPRPRRRLPPHVDDGHPDEPLDEPAQEANKPLTDEECRERLKKMGFVRSAMIQDEPTTKPPAKSAEPPVAYDAELAASMKALEATNYEDEMKRYRKAQRLSRYRFSDGLSTLVD